MQRKDFLKLSAGAAAMLAAPRLALSQSNRPIRLIVPFLATGSTDICARIIAPRLAQVIGREVRIDNVAGKGGMLGARALVEAPPDGNTLGMATVSTTGTGPIVRRVIQYDPLVDFSPVIKVVDVPGVVSVHPSFPATNFRDWVAHLRANPGKYSYGSSGSGSVQHMGMELLKLRTKTYIVHLPYRSVAPALTDLVAGRIPMVWDNLSSSLPLIKSGKVVPIGLAGGQRSPQLPTLQTFTELGLDNYSASTYFGVLAPGGTPPDVVRTLNDALNRVIQDPTINEQLVRAGGVPIGGSPEVLKHQIENELRKWAEVAAYAKVRVG